MHTEFSLTPADIVFKLVSETLSGKEFPVSHIPMVCVKGCLLSGTAQAGPVKLQDDDLKRHVI